MDAGVVFPMVDGHRSTSAAGRAVAADAVRSLDPQFAAEIEAERDWRRGYLDSYRRMTTLGALAEDALVAVARDGLCSVHRQFRYRAEGRDLPLAEAIRAGADRLARVPALHTAVVRGGQPAGPELSLPLHGERLSGDRLARKLDDWVRDGIVEPSLAEAVRAVMAHPEWLDLRDVTVAVLGAGAEVGPFLSLVRWGAHVLAVDLPVSSTWRRLIALVRDSPGRMSVPVNRWLPEGASDAEIAEAAGADVTTQTPELLTWLAGVDGPFTLGSYVYADGPQHVRASVAVDALTVELTRARPEVSLAFLATPTDTFIVPDEVAVDSRQRYDRRATLHRFGRLSSAGLLYARNYEAALTLPDGREVWLNDSLVPQQGPNYALAKRIQRWRAQLDRSAGRLVSLNVAPPTRTRSVLRNRVLAAAYAGAYRFGVEVFEPATSNTLMAALLVHDLRNPSAAANPASSLAHPEELLWQGAGHGGLWRTPYAPRSVLGIAVVLGMIRRSA